MIGQSTYATAAPTTGDSVTVALTGLQEFTNYIRWPDNVDLLAPHFLLIPSPKSLIL